MRVKIDGSYGEGGGQILRTSLALAAITGQDVEITNIRARRKNPGLAAQHLTSVNALCKITGGYAEGAKLGSTSLIFVPVEVMGGDYVFDVGSVTSSAGATGLIFQAILPALIFSPETSRVTIRGGTHVPWSPPFHYLRDVFLPTIKKMGVEVELEIGNWGWYPKGGGEIVASIEPVGSLKPLRLVERGGLKRIRGFSAVSNLPTSIAQRQMRRGVKTLKDAGYQAEIEIEEASSIGQGTFFFLQSEFEGCRAGFDSLGRKGKRAEVVAEEACDELIDFLGSNATVDRALGDQLIPYLALAAGESEFIAHEISEHLLTNIWAVEQFLPLKFSLDRGSKRVRVKGSRGASERGGGGAGLSFGEGERGSRGARGRRC